MSAGAWGRLAVLGGAPIVTAAMLAWNIGNFVFFFVAGRLIGPDEYGLLAALLAITIVATIPAAALPAAVVRAESDVVRAAPEAAGAIYRWALGWTAVVLPFIAGAAIGIAALVGALTEAPAGPLMLTVAAIAPIPLLFLSLGQLQAEHRFMGYSGALSLIGVPRAPFFLLLLPVMAGVYAGLLASAGAVVLAFAVAIALTWTSLRSRVPAPAGVKRAFVRSLPPVTVGLVGVALLAQADIVAAEVSLAGDTAGRFAAVAVLGKAVVLIPQGVSVAVLPRVAARKAAGQDTGPLLALAVTATVVGGLVATAVAAVIAKPLIELTYGSDFAASSDLLAPIALVSTLLGVLIVLTNHHAGRRGDRFLWVIGLMALALPLLFVALHGSATQLIVADAIAYSAILVVHELIYGRGPDGIVRGVYLLLRHGRAALAPTALPDRTGLG